MPDEGSLSAETDPSSVFASRSHRQSAARKKASITSEIITLYRAVLATDEDGYNVASLALHVALGRKPWQTDVPDTIGADEPPDWMRGADRRDDWQNACEILRHLDVTVG